MTLTRNSNMEATNTLKRSADETLKVASEPQCHTDHLSQTKMAQKLAHYQQKARDSKRVILRLKRQKDNELQTVTNQLLLLEGHLRREQKEIQSQLAQRNHVIEAQSQEIDRLRRDNRRLINRLKKFSDMHDTQDIEQLEPRSKVGRLESVEEYQSPSKVITSLIASSTNAMPTSPLQSPMNMSNKIKVGNSISELINSNENSPMLRTPPNLSRISNNYNSPNSYHPDNVNPNVLIIRATTDRVLHKPPIAEKPKVSPRIAKTSPSIVAASGEILLPVNKKDCSIVTTIGRLLEEESDGNVTTGSSNSEPSSPEATLKTVTPKIIRMHRKFDESLTASNLALHIQQGSSILDSSLDSERQEEINHKSYISDEYEVTSGYNSDAVSGYNSDVVSDHDYENIRIGAQIGCEDTPKKQTKDSNKIDKEEDDNYVVFREVKKNDKNMTDETDDHHIYSNVEYNLTFKGSKRSQNLRQSNVARTLSDASTSSDDTLMSEGMRPVRNMPRSRQNIKSLIDNSGNHMTENFEEFTLDSLEFEEDHHQEHTAGNDNNGKENLSEQRKRGDGAETENENKSDNSKTPTKPSSQSSHLTKEQYEHFLESTGLSQKSILTPTRSLINHRSMLKPRDIKHRNKLRTAFSTLSTLEEVPVTGYKYYV
ncbi:unnamed protein product [Meganyctiphanes norvegica]|uniref:Uncharacterized protein n=1 Tax=Meganyctiphanes norvegica TaxID=48144 RepID=A0AAV2PWA4_MEGNR